MVNARELCSLARALMDDIKANSRIVAMNYKQHGELRIQCTFPKYSKAIIDRIDCVLGRHFGMTPDEIDFIINYDIKYRMGSDGAED
jgi:hypothetical protein